MLQEDSIPTAFFYFARSMAEPARARPAEVLSALLKQLYISGTDQSVRESVTKEYDVRSRKAEDEGCTIKRLTVEDCIGLIVKFAVDRPAILVFDALDECEEDTRDQLLEAFDEIIESSNSVVRIFVSSRDDIDIVIVFLDVKP